MTMTGCMWYFGAQSENFIFCILAGSQIVFPEGGERGILLKIVTTELILQIFKGSRCIYPEILLKMIVIKYSYQPEWLRYIHGACVCRSVKQGGYGCPVRNEI